MSLIGQLAKGVMAGMGWTLGKKGAEDASDFVTKKLKERQSGAKGELDLEEIEIAPDKDEK